MKLKGNLVLSILFLFIGYAIAPNYYVRNKSKQVVRTLPYKGKKIALTFDDGPDRRYTEKVLDVLKKYQIKATFFVVAEKVTANKTIIERMQKEGHVIGLHSLKHKSAWLMPPWEAIEEIPKALKVLQDCGIEVTYFRPPWGTFNLLTLWQARKHHLKTILWSVEAYDWRQNMTGNRIRDILLDRVKVKDIIVLHDSGGAPWAPLNTIDGLKKTLPIWLNQGYEFITIDE